MNSVQLDPKTWHSVGSEDKITLAEFEGYLQF